VLPPKIGPRTWVFFAFPVLAFRSKPFHPLKLRESCYLPAKMAFWRGHDSCQA
jgi:hypothetical protein